MQKESTNNNKSWTLERFHEISTDLTDITRNITIFDDEKVSIWSIIKYHKWTNIPTFFPSRYQEQEWIQIFEQIDEKLNTAIEEIKKIEVVTNNIKMDELLRSQKKWAIRDILKLKKLKEFEAEKLWYTIDPQKRIKLYEEGQKMSLNGRARIIDQPEEMESISNYLTSLPMDKLDSKEKNTFNVFLQKLPKSRKNNTKKALPTRNTIPEKLESVSIETQLLVMQLWTLFYQIQDGPVSKELTDLLFEIHTWKIERKDMLSKLQEHAERKAITTSQSNMKISNISKTIEMPDEKKSETSDRICKLLNHEITRHILWHMNREKGTKINVWNNHVPLEEWVAIVSDLLRKYTLDEIIQSDIPPTEHHIAVVIREMHNKKDAEELIRIFFKLIGRKENAAGRANRVSRYGPDDLPWSYGKDQDYTKGLRKVVEQINNLHKNHIDLDDWEDLIRLVFSTKSSFAAIKTWQTKEMYDLLNKSDLKKEFWSPVLIGTILYNRLSQWETKKAEIINSFHDVKLSHTQKSIILTMEKLMRTDKLCLAA